MRNCARTSCFDGFDAKFFVWVSNKPHARISQSSNLVWLLSVSSTYFAFPASLNQTLCLLYFLSVPLSTVSHTFHQHIYWHAPSHSTRLPLRPIITSFSMMSIISKVLVIKSSLIPAVLSSNKQIIYSQSNDQKKTKWADGQPSKLPVVLRRNDALFETKYLPLYHLKTLIKINFPSSCLFMLNTCTSPPFFVVFQKNYFRNRSSSLIFLVP